MGEPTRQSYLGIQEEEYRGRLALNIANIRKFKSNIYIKDDPNLELLNNDLLKPYDGELYYDDDFYVYICKVSKDPSTGAIQYTYISKEKEVAEKLTKYEREGVLNQLMAAYHNGKVYKFYGNLDSHMMFPDSSLIFPPSYLKYTVREQKLNVNNKYIYVCGKLNNENNIENVMIPMEQVTDVAANTKYSKMKSGLLFTTTNEANQYSQIEHGKFYIIDFYGIDQNDNPIILDTKLFQAVTTPSIIDPFTGHQLQMGNNVIPIENIERLDVSVYRQGHVEVTNNDTYAIFSGENISDTLSFTVEVVYSDGNRKDISNLLDTGQLTRLGWDFDSTSALPGAIFDVSFVYKPFRNPDGSGPQTIVTKTIHFQVVTSTSNRIKRIIPVMWTDLGPSSAANHTRIYRFRLFTLDDHGVLENRSRHFFNTVKKVSTNQSLTEEINCPFAYDSYEHDVSFVFNPNSPTNITGQNILSFKLYNESNLKEYRFQTKFGDTDNENNSTMITSLNGISYGYDENGVLSKLKETYKTFNDNNVQKLTHRATVNLKTIPKTIELSVQDSSSTFHTMYGLNPNKPGKVVLYSVKEQYYTAITSIKTFTPSDTKIVCEILNQDNIKSIVNKFTNRDFVLAKFYSQDTNDVETLKDIEVFNVKLIN